MSSEVPPPNPYTPPVVGSELSQARLAFSIGATYWLLMGIALVICSAMVLVPWFFTVSPRRRDFFPVAFQTPPMGLGLFGCLVVVTGAIFGVGYLIRVVRKRYTRRHERMRARPFVFFVHSLAIGFLTAITTLTSFVTCCVPVGMLTVSYSAGGIHSDTRAAEITGIVVASFVGLMLIYLLLPRGDLREDLT